MDIYSILLLLSFTTAVCLIQHVAAQHENIPYENVANICETCVCLETQAVANKNQTHHNTLSCVMKGFKHILARWPEEFGKHNYKDNIIVASFSGNTIDILQQLPSTNSTLSFACRHCGIKHLQAPTFMDVPNIISLDLAYNEITNDELTPDVFRGPYHITSYEPIALKELDLSHNKLSSLDRRIFEHTPNITKLNLSWNDFKVLDNPTTMALASASLLQDLDLSHTGIKSMATVIFEKLTSLKTLNLAGNDFVHLPENFQLIGQSMRSLNLAGNKFNDFSEGSFLGLKALLRLNISGMPNLKSIQNNTFSRLEHLTHLDCSNNHKLETFDLDSLMHCGNLTYLDISYCSLTTLNLNMDLSSVSAANNTNVTLPKPWPLLKTFKTIGNLWMCDCQLFQVLEYTGSHHLYADEPIRCDGPYIFAGARLSNLTSTQICSMEIPIKYKVIDEDPPRFRRKRYIILTVITASVVVVLGLIIGFIVVCIRRRLKRDDFGVEPIRYTSVRSSNLSAFSQGHTNGALSNGSV
ncbi:P-granule-associated novel protein 1 [Calliphora vicina]|uniref:P-granule-associated novel protein 1 n=1 Tax=Calliphora vicina TaxID=7373 RepID=UPI00325BA3B3